MIGVFDSGVGGLSVLRHIRAALPTADLVYVGDSRRAPYGDLPVETIRSHSQEIAGHLMGRGARVVVIACNTASAAALDEVRAAHPEAAVVGMEPAVKPAARSTATGRVGVLATAATAQAPRLTRLIDRHAGGVTVETVACRGWVDLVERGMVTGPAVRRAVARHVVPLVERGADRLVLGCTHFPFLADVIAHVAGPGVELVDPGPAVARRTAEMALEAGAAGGGSTLECWTTGDDLDTLRRSGRLAGLELHPQLLTF